MIWDLSCDFVDRGRVRVLDCGAPALTVADPCIWHAA